MKLSTLLAIVQIISGLGSIFSIVWAHLPKKTIPMQMNKSAGDLFMIQPQVSSSIDHTWMIIGIILAAVFLIIPIVIRIVRFYARRK